jgi:DNA polymerase I-like protein with 3'-5' exonuclease and polymerase domains
MIQNGICALDFETTGLNNRVDQNGNPYIKIVGVCLSCDPDEGYYIPVNHEDRKLQRPTGVMLRELKRLCANCVIICHNFKYDGEVLRNNGIVVE